MIERIKKVSLITKHVALVPYDESYPFVLEADIPVPSWVPALHR